MTHIPQNKRWLEILRHMLGGAMMPRNYFVAGIESPDHLTLFEMSKAGLVEQGMMPDYLSQHGQVIFHATPRGKLYAYEPLAFLKEIRAKLERGRRNAMEDLGIAEEEAELMAEGADQFYKFAMACLAENGVLPIPDDSDYRIDFKKVSNVVVAGIDGNDYPDFCDAYIESCDYKGRAATAEEIEVINENSEFVQEAAHRQLH